MRNDLISRNTLLKALEEKVYPEKYGEKCNAFDVINGVLQVIDEQPTAYDVDKVVEKLKQIKTDNSCKNCTYREKCDELQEFYNPSDEDDLCALVTKELSIQIVKSGGIERKMMKK